MPMPGLQQTVLIDFNNIVGHWQRMTVPQQVYTFNWFEQYGYYAHARQAHEELTQYLQDRGEPFPVLLNPERIQLSDAQPWNPGEWREVRADDLWSEAQITLPPRNGRVPQGSDVILSYQLPRNNSIPNMLPEESPFGEWERNNKSLIKR